MVGDKEEETSVDWNDSTVYLKQMMNWGPGEETADLMLDTDLGAPEDEPAINDEAENGPRVAPTPRPYPKPVLVASPWQTSHRRPRRRRRRRNCGFSSMADLDTIEEVETESGSATVHPEPSGYQQLTYTKQTHNARIRRAKSGEIAVLLQQLNSDKSTVDNLEICETKSGTSSGGGSGRLAPVRRASSSDDSCSYQMSEEIAAYCGRAQNVAVQVLFSQKSKRVVRQKSLLAANRECEVSRKGSFDSVAMAFWLVQLQQGTCLTHVKIAGDPAGVKKEFFLRVAKDGKLILQWKTQNLFVWKSSLEFNGDTKVVDSKAFEFQLDLGSRKGPILVRAPDMPTFEMWTHGMKYILAYSSYIKERNTSLPL